MTTELRDSIQDMKRKGNDSAPHRFCRGDIVLAEKKIRKKVPLITDPPSSLKSKNNTNPCVVRSYRSLGTK